MNTDPLESFIRNRRDEFDDLEPSGKVWERIQQRQKQPRIVHWRSIATKAAAVAAIFMLGYLFSVWTGKGPVSDQYADDMQQENLPEYAVLKEARIYYSSLINQKQEQVFRLTSGNEQLQNDLKEEFDVLDRAFRSLEKDLNDQVATEEVIEAMIQHYRIKLDMLEDILYQLKSASGAEKEEVRHVI
jgi:hypothetical protein